MGHRLRHIAKGSITDSELNEVENLIDFDYYSDSERFEYNGNYALTKDKKTFDDIVFNLCCGIHTQEITLKNKDKVYFCFDYGH